MFHRNVVVFYRTTWSYKTVELIHILTDVRTNAGLYHLLVRKLIDIEGHLCTRMQNTSPSELTDMTAVVNI
jgi:hypothetical protein